MKAGLRGLYLVTPEQSDSERLLADCAAALRGGPALVQYRAKNVAPALRHHQASALLVLCRAVGVPMLVNDDLALALAIGADGAHLGRDDGDLGAARAALGAGRLLGVSCYDDFALAERAVAAGADYVAFGAMYPSPTKPLTVRASPSLLGRAREQLRVPVAAIGGITLDGGPVLIEAGASLLAVISDVFEAPDPEARVRSYAALFANAALPRQD